MPRRPRQTSLELVSADEAMSCLALPVREQYRRHMTGADETTLAREPKGMPTTGSQRAGNGSADPSEQGLFGRWQEHFTLKAARAISSKLAEPDRLRLHRATTVTQQKLQAAETLWYAGHRAEGLRLIEQASSWARRAQAICAGISDEEINQHEGAEAGDNGAFLDAEIDSTREVAFHGHMSDVKAVLRVASQGAAPPKTLRRRRFVRIAQPIVGMLAAVAALAFWLYEPPHLEASATHQQAEWPARFAIDGHDETEWQAHDRQKPTLDVELIPPRMVTGLRLLNGHNRWYNDRAVGRYRIELLRRGEVVTTIPGEFEELTPSPDWVVHETEAAEVDHIRFIVLTHHGVGSSLAELRIDERPTE